MASNASMASLGAAGIAAMFGGAAFLSAAPSNSGNLRASAPVEVAAQAAPAPDAFGNVSSQAAVGAAGVTSVAMLANLAAGSRKKSSAQKMVALHAFENETGVQPPVGFWDPLGLAAGGNMSDFNRRREVELKHGRVSMFATIGYILPEYWRFPGYLSKYLDIKFADIPNGLGAASKLPALSWLQIVGFAGIIEVNVYNEQVNGEPGNYGAGFLGLRSVGIMSTGISDPEVRKKKLNAELANGRLAMMAIIGMFFQDGLTGSAWGDWALYTASPLRAFEGELGVQPPVGFWDPLGLSADGDVAFFKRRREVELKHGRISMFACIGYIVPEYFKFPGELSPKLGLQFADIPNGLAALSKVPGQGWAQIVAFLGTYELFINGKSINDEPGNYGKGNLGLGFLGPVKDPEARKKKLSAELANGRLAMMAIMGMLFQDGLTGSAWGDWALYTDSPLRSGKLSPGFNTLPEWEKPKSGFEGLLGDQAPLGLWDPAGFTKDGNVENFKRRRETELKHGRVSMFATIGYIVPEYFKFDGYCSPSQNLKFADIPNGLKALSVVPKEGWAQMVAFAGFIELAVNRPTGEPGNYGKGFLGLGTLGVSASIQDPDVRSKKLAAEIANGRLAMAAIIGMFFQDGLTGSAWGDWALYTDSPLRAFENELGVQAPVGFFDPFGMTKDGDVEAFKRRRATELKNGRVAMFACMGYIVPEYTRFPGFCSPSAGVKFAEIPNGLAAVSKVPGAGWMQIFLFLGLVEKGFYTYDPTRAPGDFKNGGVLGVPNGSTMVQGDARTKKLNSELANCRLAMMAITGMWFQDGLTGSAWGDWSLYTDSPLRAFENELGVQAPVGYFDPLGLAKDGDVDTFKRRREVELKNGRVAMFAAMGYIAPQYFRFPGYLSPSLKVKFDDVPNGLQAFSKVPFLGWVQILIFCGLVDFGLYRADPSRDPGDYENAGILGVPNASGPMSDVEGRKRKLNSELANGRLAMVAILGMMFQNGTVGTTGPEMWGF